MTDGQPYVLFRNGWALPTNSCECASQGDVTFDLEKYGPYINKIRALFVPSLEYRLRSLLEEFVYNADSRLAGQFPRFKKLVDMVATWKGPLNRAAEYDIDTMNEAIKSAVRCMTRSDLVTCFLDSIVLHRRLNKICRELDALGIEDNILRSLNVWNLVNERDYWANHVSFASPDTAAECSNADSSAATPGNARESARSEQSVVRSAINRDERHRDGGISCVQRITSDSRARRASGSRESLPRREEEGDSDCSTCGGVAGSRNDGTVERTSEFCIDEYRDDRERAKGPASESPRLKIIIRKVYLEDCDYSTLSSAVTARLPVPCKPCDLIGRIFAADPSLVESCLIVMKRKFEGGLYNVCSCLNNILGKLDDGPLRLVAGALRLSCDIRPGYISFKLRIGGAGNAGRCLFVARVPICQHVRRPTCQRDFATSSGGSAPNIGIEGESRRSARREGNGNDLCNTLARIEEESEKVDDTCRSNRTADIADIDASRGKTENIDEAESILPINEDISQHDHDSALCFCNEPSENVVETVAGMLRTLRTDRPEEENEEALVIDHDVDVEKRKEKNFDLDSPIAKNDKAERFANDADYTCSSYENRERTKSKDEDTLNNKDASSSSWTTEARERDWICSSYKELNAETKECSNTCSITSFVQGSERDKQLVELNYNRFSGNGRIVASDKRSNKTENDNSFDSARVEVGCDPTCSRCRDDYIDITIVNSVSEENISRAFEASRDDPGATKNAIHSRKVSSKDNNSLTTSVQTSRLRVSSKGINVDVSYPRTVIWLASGDDRGIVSTVASTRGGRDDRAEFCARASTVPRRGAEISRDTAGREVFDAVGRTRGFVKSSARCSARRSKERLRLNVNSGSSGDTTEAYSRARVSNASRFCRTLATSERTDGKFRGSRRSCERVRASSSDGVCSATTSVTTVRCRTTTRGRRNDRSAGARPQTAFVSTKFRNSVDRIKRLLPARLARALFDYRGRATSASTGVSRGGEEFSGCIARQEANRRRSGRGYSPVTSCSSSDCRRRGCAVSCDESSNVTVSIRGKSRGEERSEGESKFSERRLQAGGSETLSDLRSTETLPRSCDSLAPAPQVPQERGSNGRRRCLAKQEIKSERNARRYSKNFRLLGNQSANVTISSRSTEISFTENDSRYSERYTCKWSRETRDNGHRGVCERCDDERGKYRSSPIIKYVSNDGDDFSETSSFETLPIPLFAWAGKARNVRKELRSASRPRNVTKFPLVGRDRKIFAKPANTFDFSDDRSRKKRALAMLIRQDCANDLDLDFRSQLSRYVQLCKNVKRSLMKTLQPDDVVSTASMFDSDT